MAKNSRSNLVASDLYALGTCFAPVMPNSALASLSPADFFSVSIFFQGLLFQPSPATAALISAKIDALLSPSGLNKSAEAVLAQLGDTMLYYAPIGERWSTTLQGAMETYAPGLLRQMRANKDVVAGGKAVETARLGAGDYSLTRDALDNFRHLFATQLIADNSPQNNRKKRCSFLFFTISICSDFRLT